MKLSKKVTVIFIASTIMTIILYKVSSNIMINHFYKGEVTRITGISSGGINRIKSEVNKTLSKAKDYSSSINTARRLEREYGIENGEEELGIDQKFKRDNIKYKFTLTPDLQVEKMYFENSDKEEFNILLNEIRKIIPNENKAIEGIMAIERGPYTVSVDKLRDKESVTNSGYFVAITPIGDGFVEEISDSMGKNITLEKSLDSELVAEVAITNAGDEVYLITTDNNISSYYKLPSIHGEGTYYIKVEEDLVVKNSTRGNLNTFTILLAVLCAVTNLVVFIVIEKLVIRRIVKINRGINSIRESKRLSDRIDEEVGNDEISILSKDINYMINSLEESNNIIIKNEKKFSEEMQHLAEYDVVTTLLNRYSLYNYMEGLKSQKKAFIVYFIDLDNFKNLNDTLGHSTGDEVLCGAASALLSLENDKVTVGRLGGDEFIVIKTGDYDMEEINEFGWQILKSLNQTFKYKNYTYELRGSIGISLYPQDADDIETLLKYADIAMYKSKSNGGNCIDKISNEMLEEIEIESQLKEAVKNKEFVTYYQPIYDVNMHKIIGAEALVRWIRDGKIVPPLKFISIAKKSGDIIDIDRFVLEEACKFCKQWRGKGYEKFQVSVNASYRFLKKPNFAVMLKAVLDKYNLSADGLKLEITEDEILDEPKYIINILKEIKALGVKVSLDDFGIGYSSFNHIKMLPIDTIKIDRSLLLKIEEDEKSAAIIGTLIDLSHTLDLDVVCEGVEEKQQLEILRKLNCDKIQGYYISRPILKEDFVWVIEKYNN